MFGGIRSGLEALQHIPKINEIFNFITKFRHVLCCRRPLVTSSMRGAEVWDLTRALIFRSVGLIYLVNSEYHAFVDNCANSSTQASCKFLGRSITFSRTSTARMKCGLGNPPRNAARFGDLLRLPVKFYCILLAYS